MKDDDHNKGHDATTVLYPEDDWTAIFRRVPGYKRFREWRVRSWAVLLSAVSVGALTLALDSYFDWREARFASSPGMNRPADSGGNGFLLVTPMWGLAALLLIWGVMQRRAEGRIVGRGGFEAPAVVEKIVEEQPGSFVLTYRYEAGVKGTQYGQCEIGEADARQLAPGTAGRVRVDPIHPARSDWLGP